MLQNELLQSLGSRPQEPGPLVVEELLVLRRGRVRVAVVAVVVASVRLDQVEVRQGGEASRHVVGEPEGTVKCPRLDTFVVILITILDVSPRQEGARVVFVVEPGSQKAQVQVGDGFCVGGKNLFQ